MYLVFLLNLVTQQTVSRNSDGAQGTECLNTDFHHKLEILNRFIIYINEAVEDL